MESAWEAAGETRSLFKAEDALPTPELIDGVMGVEKDTVGGVTQVVVVVCVAGVLVFSSSFPLISVSVASVSPSSIKTLPFFLRSSLSISDWVTMPRKSPSGIMFSSHSFIICVITDLGIYQGSSGANLVRFGF